MTPAIYTRGAGLGALAPAAASPAAAAALATSHFDEARRRGWLPLFTAAGARHGVAPSILMAIASRESEMGRSASLVNWRSKWNPSMVSIMQLNERFHQVRPDDHAGAIDTAAAYLAGEIRRKFPNNLRAQLAAYNRGPYDKRLNDLVAAGLDPDGATDGGNYAADVLARAGTFEQLLAGGGQVIQSGFSLGPGLTLPGLNLVATDTGAGVDAFFDSVRSILEGLTSPSPSTPGLETPPPTSYPSASLPPWLVPALIVAGAGVAAVLVTR